MRGILNKTQILKKMLLLDCYLAFIFGLLACFVYIAGGITEIGDSLFYMAVGTIFANAFPVISGLFVLFFIATTILFLKLTDKNRQPKKYYAIMIIGIFISGVMCLPLLATPFTIQNAEAEFVTTYGSDWNSGIPEDVSVHFKKTPFNLPEYFLGTPSKQCDVVLHVLFYNDSDITLFFDVYKPTKEQARLDDLPGQNSTIINIHGGGWVTGDKGFANIPSVSRYLAAQGYIVFDIQYGLTNISGVTSFLPTLPAWSHKIGNFTVADQVSHIGIFTKYLANHSSEYGANLNSTFIMGRSAGAHLTGIVGFGYEDDYFSGVFSEEITLKGIIPIYPPDDVEIIFTYAFPGMIPGSPETHPTEWEKYQPSKLINSDTPPVLIFQGSHDPWVRPYNSESIKVASTTNGVKCCLLLLHYSGHGSDYFSQGNFNQVFMYYLERFLYMNR